VPDTLTSLEEVQASFERQGFMHTLGASLTHVASGAATISVPFTPHLTQQNGFAHAGVIATIADTACGYAAMSSAPAGCNPLAVEFKINLLAPAKGDRFEARATVLRRGRTLTVVRADVLAITDGSEELIATILETVIVR
jgi:uncharacterized protein (TIGR00369 family)